MIDGEHGDSTALRAIWVSAQKDPALKNAI
jgi:hypothetical protein